VTLQTSAPAGPIAREIDGLWIFMLVLGVAVFVLVVALMVIALVRRGRDESDGASERPWLVGSVILSVSGVAAVLVATLALMGSTPEDDPGALTIEVVGRQWWWEVRYPDHGVVTANEVHIPAGERVRLLLTSGDVVHSFWVPALAGKKDLIPEDITTLMIEADEPGTYRGQCAEFCGLQHANMGILVEAASPGDFEAWVDAQGGPAATPDTDQEVRGADVFAQAGCGRCHTVAGTGAAGQTGPDLTHLASRRTLAAGTLENTTDDLEAWITDPHVYKEGVAMEPAPPLEDDELDALVAYLESLE
jgi:cytochrome c oxidase subunit II